MRILALNCGSSSLKCALIDSDLRQRLQEARVENLGTVHCRLHDGDATQDLADNTTLSVALKLLLETLLKKHSVDAVVHRVVHGGSVFTRPTVIDSDVMSTLQELTTLAPLHNPPALAAIHSSRNMLPAVPHIAVFDTAFHATLPRRAREYALPTDLTRQHGIRRFGFHGISHAHAMRCAAGHLQQTPQALRMISCHLGSGASVTAIEYGCSVDTSMGMTPLEGLVMGTRAGDVDPGVLVQLLRSGAMDVQALDTVLNTQSGLKGMTGTSDLRDIELRAAAGDDSCQMAIAVYVHRVRKYLGAYAAVMGGVDVITFTGGVGENSPAIRHRIAQRLHFLGAELDEDANRKVQLSADDAVADIATPPSRTRLLVLRADEEMSMALAATELLHAMQAPTAIDRHVRVAVSARHAHLSQSTLDVLFGANYRLQSRAPLTQTGQFAAQETVTLIGPHGQLEHVRLIGPPRESDQVELARSDEFALGIDAPVRISGDLTNTPGITVAGPNGRLTLRSGVIAARRHLHMNPTDAERLHLRDHDSVRVKLGKAGRELIFNDVVVRVDASFNLELHLDTDEANAAGVTTGDIAEILPP
jgi:acetate kinase